MKKTAYLDTTIPSFYFETRNDLESSYKKMITREWWKNERHLYRVFISEMVQKELERGNYPFKPQALEFISLIPILQLTDEIEEIVQVYIKSKLMPQADVGDAFHLAISSYYKMDYLLTWNCNHLANANKNRQIALLNNRLKLYVPNIVTPELLFSERGE